MTMEEGFFLGHTQRVHVLMLFVAATIWGGAFVAQSVGMDYVGPFTFTMARSVLGALVLVPVILFFSRADGWQLMATGVPRNVLWKSGLTCGFFMCTGTLFQQYGIMYTTVGKAGFITAFYIVLVPLVGIFLGKKTASSIWLAVGLALVGLYFLTMRGGFDVGLGDGLILIGAVLFTGQILSIDHYVSMVDGVVLSCMQLAVSAVLSGVLVILFETPSWTQLLAAWQPILYAGILSSGVSYTLQILGQRGLDPTLASLVLSLESCISVLAGWLLLGELLSAREAFGCVLMFVAIILAQLPKRTFNRT